MTAAMRRRAPVWTEARTRRLVELRRDGISNDEICKLLRVSLPQLQVEIRRLMQHGVLESRRFLLVSHPDAYVAGRERTAADVEADIARLYLLGWSYREIGEALTLTRAQVHNRLTDLFAAGMPKRAARKLEHVQVRAIHASYMNGGSINQEAGAIGFTGSAVRAVMRKLDLPKRHANQASKVGHGQ